MDDRDIIHHLTNRLGRSDIPPYADAEVARFVERAVQSGVVLGRWTLPRGARTPWWESVRSVRRVLATTALTMLVVTIGRTLFQQHPAETIVQQYHTAPGRRLTVQLAGGSTMILGPATSVEVTSSAIAVTGEAYFAVVPHPEHPFVVHTANTVVRVLGTRFSVRQYVDEAQSRVAVDAGRVGLRLRGAHADTAAQTVVSARMCAQISDSGVTVMSGTAAGTYTDWTRGMLVFNKVPLREVVAELTRTYGADIRIVDTTLANRRMRIDVAVSEESLSQVLDVIGDVANAHYVRDGHVYVVTPGRAPLPTHHGIPVRQPFPQLEQSYGR